MKKKYLLLTLLALAIITSLTAGTLAVYTSKVDLADVNVEAKRFVFDAAGSIDGDNESINLAPSESMTYSFNITNYKDKGSPAEVPLVYTIGIDFAEAAAKMSGLTATMTMNGKEVSLEQSSLGVFTYGGGATPADKQEQDDYVLTLTWVDDNNDSSHTEAGTAKVNGGLKVSITATQDTSGNNGNNGNNQNNGNGNGN